MDNKPDAAVEDLAKVEVEDVMGDEMGDVAVGIIILDWLAYLYLT